MNNYYVYEWIRLDTNEPFYVGMGHSNRCYQLTRGNNYHFNNIVKSIPVAVNILHDNLDEQTAFGLEVWYIREYRDIIGYNLTNINDGGEGNAMKGENHPFYGKKRPEHAEKMRIKFKGENNPMYGRKGSNNPNYKKHHTEETKKKISEANKGNKHTDEQKKKIGMSMKGKLAGENHPMYGKYGKDNPNYGSKRSQETKEKMSKSRQNKKSVICLTTKRIFLSTTEGARYYECSKSSIGKCCKGKMKSCGKLFEGTKLIWRYLIWNHNKIYRIKEKK